jgi:dipeptidyl aminopeptidase/acylaminoacyl peptidase
LSIPRAVELAARALSIRSPRAVTLAPGGHRVAYVVGCASQVSDGYLSRLQVIEADGQDTTWVESAGAISGLAWSADGGTLAFVAGGSLWVCQGPSRLERWYDGSEGGGLGAPRWIGATEELVVVRGGQPMGRSPTRLTSLPYKHEGFGYRASPAQVLRLSRSGHEVLAARSERGPLWALPSPDGRRLAIAEPLSGHDEIGQLAVRVVAVERWQEDGERLALPDVVTALAWSPDSARLAALAEEGPWGSVGRLRLWVAQPGADAVVWDEGSDRCLQAAGGTGLVWRDARSVLVVEASRAELRLVCLHPDAPAEVVASGAGCVSEFSYDRASDRLAGVWQDPSRLSEVVEWRVDSGARTATVLTSWNPEPWRVPEELWLTGAGGDPVHAWYLPPAHGQGPAPCVFMIHGGPYMSFYRNVSLQAQALSSLGIGVAYCNPHGSSGYGFDFAHANVGDWGGADGQDWAALRDRLIADGRIDPGRLGLLGASYGGFMAAWLAGHWRGLKAAVIQAPVIDQISMLFGADLGYSWLAYEQALADGLHLSDGDVLDLWHHSPLAYADRVEAKVLLLAGDKDNRCPMHQAEELYVALRRRRHPVEMVVYPGENHLLDSARPSTRLDRMQRILEFLGRELAG